MSRRTERIGASLMSELARLLREEVTDPRIGLVTLTRIDVAPDLSNAMVYYSALSAGGDDAIGRIDAGLASASAFLRRRAAASLPFKRMPELRFRYDPSLSLGSRTLGLLREIALESRSEDERGSGSDALQRREDRDDEAG